MRNIFFILFFISTFCKAQFMGQPCEVITPQTQAVIAKMVTPVFNKQTYVANIMIERLLSDTIFQTMDVLYCLWFQNDSDALINFAAPSSFHASRVNFPTFTLDQGYTGNVSNHRYITTGYIPLTSSTHFQHTNGSHGVYVRTNPDGTSTECAAGTSNGSGSSETDNYVFPDYTGLGVLAKTCTGGGIYVSWSPANAGVDLFVIQAFNNTSTQGFENGTLKATSSTAFHAAGGVNADEILSFNDAGVIDSYFAGQVSFRFYSGVLTLTQQVKVSNDLNFALKMLGTNIY